MKPREILEFVRPRFPSGDHRTRLLAACHSVADVERRATHRLPPAVRGYLEGGADAEVTLRANRTAWRGYRLVPRVLVDVAEVDTAVTLFGRTWSAPIGLSPTGYQRMFHPDGESGAAAAAAARRVPYAISTVATTTPAQVRAATGAAGDDLWYQLYPLRDRPATWTMLDRVRETGVDVLELAVDAPVGANRLRDKRTGFTIPPQMNPTTLAGIAAHPGYWVRLVAGPGLRLANIDGLGTGLDGGSIEAINAAFDPSVTWADLAEIRRRWDGTLVLKGLYSAQEARRARDEGVDGFHLSNHGGRQLDRGETTPALLPGLRAALGPDVPIVVDSGIRSGTDVAIALALGADAAFVGRPYLYGLVLAGEAGVCRVVDLLRAELVQAMQLLGVTSVAQLRAAGGELLRPASHHVRVPETQPHLVPETQPHLKGGEQ